MAKLLQFIRLPPRRPGATDENDPPFQLTFTVRRVDPTPTPEERAESDRLLDQTIASLERGDIADD